MFNPDFEKIRQSVLAKNEHLKNSTNPAENFTYSNITITSKLFVDMLTEYHRELMEHLTSSR